MLLNKVLEMLSSAEAKTASIKDLQALRAVLDATIVHRRKAAQLERLAQKKKGS